MPKNVSRCQNQATRVNPGGAPPPSAQNAASGRLWGLAALARLSRNVGKLVGFLPCRPVLGSVVPRKTIGGASVRDIPLPPKVVSEHLGSRKPSRTKWEIGPSRDGRGPIQD
jgi:hypothetical protein